MRARVRVDRIIFSWFNREKSWLGRRSKSKWTADNFGRASDVITDANEGWYIMTRRDHLTPLIVSNPTINWSSCTGNWYKFTYSQPHKALILPRDLDHLKIFFLRSSQLNEFPSCYYIKIKRNIISYLDAIALTKVHNIFFYSCSLRDIDLLQFYTTVLLLYNSYQYNIYTLTYF